MPGMLDRPRFWVRALSRGVAGLNALLGWFGSIVLVLGVAAGIAVPLVFHGSPWLTAVILLAAAVVIVAEGSYLEWKDADALRRKAESALEDTRTELEDARRELEDAQRAAISAPATSVPRALQPRYRQREPYRQPGRFGLAVEHRVGIRNPSDNPPATGVRLEWTEMAPRPAVEGGYPSVVPPQPVPRLTGGDPRIGVPLPPGREDYWVIATALTQPDDIILVGAFSAGSMGGQFRGLQWRFEPGRLWRFTYRIVADNQPPVEFSIAMTAVDGQIRCDLES
jgi:hypothetical protein